MLKPNPVGWFEIYVNDMPRARKFYEKVLDFKLEQLRDAPGPQGMELWFFPMERGAPGAGGALVKMPGFEAGTTSVLIYFTSEDCAVEQGRVVAAGGQIQKPKMSIGEYGFICLAVDTEGNMFGIHSRK